MKNNFIIVLLINILLLSAQLYLSSTRASDGDRIAEISYQLTEYKRQNASLENQIYELTSTPRLLEFAHNSGLKPANLTFLKALSVADRSSTWNGE